MIKYDYKELNDIIMKYNISDAILTNKLEKLYKSRTISTDDTTSIIDLDSTTLIESKSILKVVNILNGYSGYNGGNIYVFLGDHWINMNVNNLHKYLSEESLMDGITFENFYIINKTSDCPVMLSVGYGFPSIYNESDNFMTIDRFLSLLIDKFISNI